ncbi:MAG TPA: hypothetical protein VK706_07860 [Candidatus Sulfotelmatobacter sp.]|jgi:hypothetical protein|nr:hypothetical protein [Candidatus Sulfotelmatobacter sp.]
MNVFDSNTPRTTASNEAEETLRLLANLPTPEGLEARVHLAIKQAPRSGAVLSWPHSSGSKSAWANSPFARGAAAAAIVAAVMGGCWEVYTRVQPAPSPNTYAMPRVAAPNGFSSANAMRTPRTLNGPVISPGQVKKNPAQKTDPRSVSSSPTKAQTPSK